MDWQQTIKDMTDKGLITLGKLNEGNELLAELEHKAAIRNKLYVLWRIFCLSEFSVDWFYWEDYNKENKN